ncbi:FG-GAP-like repeat-containing protein [Botrimarina sp.]|uniref:FG-GAP-like repeat-containing protein n=1 Tax=Botrimarina sp. TaxID=2795802 RepID=UPI0032EDE95A
MKAILFAATLSALVLAAADARAGFTEAGAALLGANHDSRSASLADFDNDGDLDLFFQGGGESQRLYANGLYGGAGFGFSDASGLLPAGLSPSWSAAWADINGDRRVDVFVGQSNIFDTGDVLLNQGPSGFANASPFLGLDDPGFHQNVAWNDIDRDNDLDLLIGMEGPDQKHEIYLQQASGAFTPVGAAVGFQPGIGTKAYGMALGDTDGDGDTDVYISTCRGNNFIENHFLENQLAETGTLSFVDIADSNGTQFVRNSYGTSFHDFDDDGDLDLFMVGADSQLTKIFRNDGGNQFTDVDQINGHPLLSDTSGDLNGGRAVDYDNDGDLDLFFHDNQPKNGKNAARKLYRNDGDWTFTDVTVAEGLHELNRGSYDSTWGDLDRDGDQDLVATTDAAWNERIYLSDESENGAHWLYVELEGPDENSTGVGATLYATLAAGTPHERTLRREANTSAGTFNQSDLPVHFGLGGFDEVSQLRVVWTDGRVQVIAGVEANRYLTVDYADLLPGDYNGDGRVDAADYSVWRDQEGYAMAGAASDSNGDIRVDAADYGAWADNYGAASGVAVPEAAAATLGLWAALAASAAARRRS